MHRLIYNSYRNIGNITSYKYLIENTEMTVVF